MHYEEIVREEIKNDPALSDEQIAQLMELPQGTFHAAFVGNISDDLVAEIGKTASTSAQELKDKYL